MTIEMRTPFTVEQVELLVETAHQRWLFEHLTMREACAAVCDEANASEWFHIVYSLMVSRGK